MYVCERDLLGKNTSKSGKNVKNRNYLQQK